MQLWLRKHSRYLTSNILWILDQAVPYKSFDICLGFLAMFLDLEILDLRLEGIRLYFFEWECRVERPEMLDSMKLILYKLDYVIFI